MRTLATVVVTLLVLAVLGLAGVLSGVYDIAASSPHSAVGRWVFQTAMERSVKRQARDIPVPHMSVEHTAMGAGHYAAMCEGCHGAPGVEPAAVGKGLNPSPPNLADQAQDWSEAELFWIVKHGIKMTGMPAWGRTDSDEELWSVVAFVKALPDTTPALYRQLKQRYGWMHDHQQHDHDGSPRDSKPDLDHDVHEPHSNDTLESPFGGTLRQAYLDDAARLMPEIQPFRDHAQRAPVSTMNW